MTSFFKILYRNFRFLTSGGFISLIDKIKLKLHPERTPGKTKFNGKPFYYSDAHALVAMYEQFFIEGIYKFKSDATHPYILDCGANVGFSTLFFKTYYPNAIIEAFEPDPDIAAQLQQNMQLHGDASVTVHTKAIWNADTTLTFYTEGGLSGSVKEVNIGTSKKVEVPTVRLKNWLNKPVDFLKIDIEGAEYEVLLDCKDALKNVQNMFLEYHSFDKQEQKLDEILKIIKDAGFRYHIHQEFVSPQPYLSRQVVLGFDLGINIYCYRS